MPCDVGGDAPTSGRHRSVQIRRVQAERIDQAGPQSGLLEEGPALPRWDRVYDHPEPLDGDTGVRHREVRHDFPVSGFASVADGSQNTGPAAGLTRLSVKCDA